MTKQSKSIDSSFKRFTLLVMSMVDTTIPQSGTTTPTIPATQDLQINLGENKVLPQNENQNTETPVLDFDLNLNLPVLDLNLDLNLSDAPKDDNRLEGEDKKNEETIIPTTSETTIQKPIEETSKVANTETTIQANDKEIAPTTIPTEILVPEGTDTTPVKTEPNIQETIVQTEVSTPISATETINKEQPTIEKVFTPSTSIETISTSSDTVSSSTEDTIPASASLQEDMKIIDALEWHASAGGLAVEASTPVQQPTIETPKTFDLDAMFINVTPPKAPESAPIPTASPTPIPPPSFTLPTTTTQVPVQAIPQVTIPHKKNTGVKVFLFAIMFVGLWFTTFFILKTMYPIEFENIFNGQTSMHASEIITGTETPPPEITGADSIVPEITGADMIGAEATSGTLDIWTGAHESPSTGENVFWALEDLGTTTIPEQPTQNDIAKLTDYATQGNNFLAQGKAMNNNTIIKYWLFISKKATTFLEDIANGKQIDNLTWYFAQFDEYIKELTNLVQQPTPTEPTPTPPVDNPTLWDPTTNDAVTPPETGTTPTPTPPPNTWLTAE